MGIIVDETRQRSRSITRFMTGEGDDRDANKVRAVMMEDKEELLKTTRELAAERLKINSLTEAANNAREGMYVN
jgi:hypothetical protein